MSASTATIPPAAADLHLHEDLTAAAGPLISSGAVSLDGRVCAGAVIRSGGTLRIAGDVQNAQITCGAEVHMPGGAIVGGRVSAFRGITCRSAGHRTKATTELFVGFDDQYLDVVEQRIVEIENTLLKAKQIRTQLDRLSHTAVSLTPAQKEQMTMLLFSAAAAQKRAAASIEQLKRNLCNMEASADPSLIVHEMLFAGVMIHFPGAWTSIETNLKGPIKLTPMFGKKIATQVTEFNSDKSFLLSSGVQPCRARAMHLQLETLGRDLCR